MSIHHNIVLAAVIGSMLLAGCQTTAPKRQSVDRSAEVRQRYQKESADDLLARAEDLFEAGVRYYKSGHAQHALKSFYESQEIFEKIETLKPRARGRLRSINAYLSKLSSTHGRMVLNFANRQFEEGKRFLNMQILDHAEGLLERLKEWDPALRDDANSLIRRIRQARQRINQQKDDLS